MKKIEIIKNNLLIGVGGKIILMALGFIVPKLYIENYGSEVNGLLSSIAQVFTYLSLLEAGVGTATTQALYNPVAQNDRDRINQIMSAATWFYRRTGMLYGIGVVIFAILYPILVHTSIGSVKVFILIILHGANGVLNYLFQAKYLSMLNAEGKGYVHVGIGTGISIFTTISKMLLISLKVDIVLVFTVYFFIGLLQILLINVYIKRNYKQLSCKVQPDFSSLSQNKSVLIHQISSLVFNNTDVIILTVFCDLKVVSIYTIYHMVISSISALLNILYGSFTPALGLTYNQDRDRFKRYYDLFELGTWIVSFSIMSVAFLLYEPFILLYTAKADINYADQYLPLLFSICQMLSFIRMPGVNAVNIAGHYKLTQGRSIIETVINLTTSIILVNFIGIYGVLFGTIAALFYRTTDFIIYSNRKIVFRNGNVILKRLALNILCSIIVILVLNPYMSRVNTLPTFLAFGFFMTVGITLLHLMVNAIFEIRNPNLRWLNVYINGILRKR